MQEEVIVFDQPLSVAVGVLVDLSGAVRAACGTLRTLGTQVLPIKPCCRSALRIAYFVDLFWLLHGMAARINMH